MGQIIFREKSGIQHKMIQILEMPYSHAMALFVFMKTDSGVMPALVVADDVPNQKEFVEELYKLCDKYCDFKTVLTKSLKK